MMELILPIFVTFLISFLSIRFGKPIAIRIGLVDEPTARKAHLGTIPLVGGVSIFIGVLFSSIIFFSHSNELNLYFLASALIVIIGVLDDFYDLPVKPRMAAQVVVASIMIYGANFSLDNLGNLFGFGDIHLGGFGSVFTIVAVLGAINAFNMVDGIDGLAGSLSIITFAALAFLLSATNNNWFLLPILFVAAIIAYLMFNLEWPSKRCKKIFMGDAGSMLIGLTVIWLLVIGSQSEIQSFKPVTALWLVAIPLIDMAAIMIRRIKKGQSPFKPDRDHLHHIFLRVGFSSKQTLLFITSISMLLTSFGIALEYLGIPEWLILLLFVLFFLFYVYLISRVWKAITFFKRLFKMNN